MKALTVSMVQIDAKGDPEDNQRRLEALVDSSPPSDLIALPEVFGLRGCDDDYRRAAEPIPGPTTRRLADIARRRRAWVLGGSLIEAADGRVFNTCTLLDRRGALVAVYRKMHLFEATLDTGQVIREQDAYTAGGEPVMAEVEGWRVGLSICYDVRFPELYRHYSMQGAHLFCVPSNFTQRTGKDHWEVLLRARAIENQCFVVAPDQCGANPRTGVASHGHSLAVDPWGEVLAQAGDEETVLTVTLDPAVLEAIRLRIPVLRHRRLG